MATPDETTWQIEPHTATKHRILRNYLNAWFPILNTHNKRLVFLDGFSGPGIYTGGEPGSPIIALKTARDHFRPIDGEAVFLFIEERPDRADNLRQEIAKLTLPTNFRVDVESSQFEPTVTRILDELDKEGKGLAPTFAFVDPFGFSGLPFNLLERLLKHDRSEAFITFMVDSINRFITAPNDEIRAHIRGLFGTDEVFNVVSGTGDRVKKLTQLYQSQLSKLGKYVRSFEMRDRNNKVIYYLQFVTKHPLGHFKMKEAMWKVDSEGDFSFSDATDPAQEVLFRTEHDKALFTILKSAFAGKTMQVSQIRTFVHDQTAYIDKHLVGSLRAAELAGQIQVAQEKTDGKPRRKNSFPDQVIITFPR
jgi:three-Cys-motif partner protein